MRHLPISKLAGQSSWVNSIVTLRFVGVKTIKQVYHFLLSYFYIRNCIFGAFVEQIFCFGSRFIENGLKVSVTDVSNVFWVSLSGARTVSLSSDSFGYGLSLIDVREQTFRVFLSLASRFS